MWEIMPAVAGIVEIPTRVPAISEFWAKPFVTHCKPSMGQGPKPPFTDAEAGNREAKQRAPGHTAGETQTWFSGPGGLAQSSPPFVYKSVERKRKRRKREYVVIQIETKTYGECE